MMRRRVAITGCGVVTAAGNELSGFWNGLLAGDCFIRPLQHFTAPGVDTVLSGGEVELGPEDGLPAEVDADARRGRCCRLALAAARRALLDAELPGDADELPRAGVVVGTTMGEERQVTDLNDSWLARGIDAIDAGFLARADNHRLAAAIARRHGARGPVMVSATACSSGNAALAWAFDAIAHGDAEVMIAGGADTFTRAVVGGFHRMGALSKSICRPFDRRRDGVSFGEGAGVLVLEELDRAQHRGARIYAELAGYGVSNDAYHVTAPEPNGEGFARGMRQALETTGTPPEQVDYVSAHGTGTPYNDVAETKAMKAVFGERAARIPISSIKAMIGHTNGAASAIEAVACSLAIRHQAVPPTARLEEADPACDLDYVPGKGRELRVGTILNLSAGFGGFNVCLVLKRLQ
jgi:3-oxoacyl-[acyl-carrier-protein] synthase II